VAVNDQAVTAPSRGQTRLGQDLVEFSFAMLGDTRRLRDDQLALDLRQIAEVPQAEGDQELAGRLERYGRPGASFRPVMRTSRRSRRLSSTASEFTPRTASISGRDTGLLVGDDRQGLEGRARQARARSGAGQPPRATGRPRRG